MGSLKNVVAQTATIETTGGDFTVSPLTAADILGLFMSHRESVQIMYDRYHESEKAEDLFVTMLVAFPEIMAEVIARAAGEFDEGGIAAARRLDFSAQIVALEKIGSLTVASVGGLVNLASLIQRLVGQAVQSGLASPPTSGSTISGDNAQSSSEQDTPTPTTTPSG